MKKRNPACKAVAFMKVLLAATGRCRAPRTVSKPIYELMK